MSKKSRIVKLESDLKITLENGEQSNVDNDLIDDKNFKGNVYDAIELINDFLEQNTLEYEYIGHGYSRFTLNGVAGPEARDALSLRGLLFYSRSEQSNAPRTNGP